MPSSWTQTRVDAAWPALAAAVKAGLTASSITTLSDVTAVSDTSYDEPPSGFASRLVSGQAGDRFRASLSIVDESRYWRVSHRWMLPTDDLGTAKTADDVQQWATNARRLERDLVLYELAESADHTSTLKDLTPAAIPGTGSIYLVQWAPGAADPDDALSKLIAHPQTLTDAKPPLTDNAEHRRGAAFRSDGGPVIQRAEDLTLEWMPSKDLDHILLVLHERLRLARLSQAVALV